MNPQQLRNAAVSQTLFGPTTLAAAMRKFGFVQADPIRAPARAQDLILRHRVRDYRASDLERRYPKLEIEEAVLFAYGFVSRETAELLHPHGPPPLTDLEARVLAIVREHGPLHPSDMHRWFGRDRILNAWGGTSRETTSTLDDLRRYGVVRVARRDAGIRIYEATPLRSTARVPAEDRARSLIGLIAEILGPIPERTLSGLAARVVKRVASPVAHRVLMNAMLASEEYRREEIDGLTYWRAPRKRMSAEHEGVKLLAPFDPIVWDRTRFEHLWGWPYRFEAYVPEQKRIRGYYALPLLWRSGVIGWANLSVARGGLRADLGYVAQKPRDGRFARELADELDRMREFLNADPAHVQKDFPRTPPSRKP